MSAHGWLLIVLTALCTSSSALFLKNGISNAGGFEFNLGVAVRLSHQPLFILGLILHFAAAIVWIKVLATVPVSTAYPLLVSITFLLILAGAMVMFQEAITTTKVLGVSMLLGGIFLISANH